MMKDITTAVFEWLNIWYFYWCLEQFIDANHIFPMISLLEKECKKKKKFINKWYNKEIKDCLTKP